VTALRTPVYSSAPKGVLYIRIIQGSEGAKIGAAGYLDAEATQKVITWLGCPVIGSNLGHSEDI